MAFHRRLAGATAIVIALGAVTACQSGGPGTSVPPAATSAQTTVPASVAPSTRPTTAPPAAIVPPPLTETFTSDLHGLSIAYPAGWATKAATEPWTEKDPPLFGTPVMDHAYDPALEDHFFLQLGSQELGTTPIEDWMQGFVRNEGCVVLGESAIPGADASTLYDCYLAIASKGGRGYFISMYTSGDEAELEAFDNTGAGRAWFDEILTTVKLTPETAKDAP